MRARPQTAVVEQKLQTRVAFLRTIVLEINFAVRAAFGIDPPLRDVIAKFTRTLLNANLSATKDLVGDISGLRARTNKHARKEEKEKKKQTFARSALRAP